MLPLHFARLREGMAHTHSLWDALRLGAREGEENEPCYGDDYYCRFTAGEKEEGFMGHIYEVQKYGAVIAVQQERRSQCASHVQSAQKATAGETVDIVI